MVSLTFIFRKKYVLRKTAVQINRSFSYHIDKNANVCISNFSMNKVKSINRSWLIYPFNFSVIASIFSAFYICISQRKTSYKNILCYSITQRRIFDSISNFSFSELIGFPISKFFGGLRICLILFQWSLMWSCLLH